MQSYDLSLSKQSISATFFTVKSMDAAFAMPVCGGRMRLSYAARTRTAAAGTLAAPLQEECP